MRVQLIYRRGFLCSSAGVRGDDPILERPSSEQRLAQRVSTPSYHSMYIMAELPHTVEGSVDYYTLSLSCFTNAGLRYGRSIYYALSRYCMCLCKGAVMMVCVCMVCVC